MVPLTIYIIGIDVVNISTIVIHSISIAIIIIIIIILIIIIMIRSSMSMHSSAVLDARLQAFWTKAMSAPVLTCHSPSDLCL